MEELPEGLRELWNEQWFEDFLTDVHKILTERSSNDEERKASKATVEFVLHSLPELSKNENRQIHEYIKGIYSLCENFESTRKLAESCNEYVRNVICTEIMQYTTFANIQSCLKISERVFKALGIEKEKLKVEEELFKEIVKQNKDDKYDSHMQEMAVKLSKKSPIFPISICKRYRTCGYFPGVYLIYYIGETSLYRNLVSPCQVKPIYVGQSTKNIFMRLRKHRERLKKAKDLKKTDFIVRFIIVDINYFASGIEGALLGFYSPLWNDKTAKLNFGNASEPNNNWNKYHIAQVKHEIEEIITNVRSYQLEMQKQGPKLTPTPL